MTGADRGVAAAALLACNGDANAAAVALLTGETPGPAPAPAPARALPKRGGGGGGVGRRGGGSADDLLASMFAYKPPPEARDAEEEEENDDRDQKPGPAKGKVPLDRHGLPLAGRGQGRSGGREDRGGTDRREPRPEIPTVDDYILVKHRNKIEKSLADIARLENKRAVGAALEPNQLAKIAKRVEVEESLGQVYLQGTSEQRERLGVCGRCGRRGHSGNDCKHASGPHHYNMIKMEISETLLVVAGPRSKAVEAPVSPPVQFAAKTAAETTSTSGQDEAEDAPPLAHIQYFDPSLLKCSDGTATPEGGTQGGDATGRPKGVSSGRPTSEGGVLVPTPFEVYT